MFLRKISHYFVFRYLMVLAALLLILVIIIDTNFEMFRSWGYFAMGYYFCTFPVIVLGWPAFELGIRRYKKKPYPLSLQRGLAYTFIAFFILPVLLTTFMLPIAGSVICAVLLWQLGKWSAEIRDLQGKNQTVPPYKFRLAVLAAAEILLYIAVSGFLMSIIFAI